MSELDEGWDGIEDLPLCVTLYNTVCIPDPYSEPNRTTVFRAREREIGDKVTTFFGVNLGPKHTTIEVDKENIRAVAHLGDSNTDE